MAKDTLFTNDSGAAGGAVDYVKDVFNDLTLPPTVNTGLTDTALTNPLGGAYLNDDSVHFAAQTLYIKDLSLIQDRSKWVQNKNTYQVIWNRSFPGVTGYIFGNQSVNKYLAGASWTLKNIGDGFGITCRARRVQFIVQGDSSTTATAQVYVDGSAGNVVDFSDVSASSSSELYPKLITLQHASSNVSNDLHDFRITALQASTLKIVGVVLYYENSGANIDVNQGTTYVDKSKLTTLTGATFTVPSPGSSLGAKSLVYKTSSNQYAIDTSSCTAIISFATGSSGTNILNVSTGHGASFKAGYGLVVSQGTSNYIGNILSVSTDSFTMGATIPWGMSATVYTAWKSGLEGSTTPINASMMQLGSIIDFEKYSMFNGATKSIIDPYGRFSVFGNGIGVSLVDSVPALYLGAAGFLQVEGRFSGAEVEYIGNGILHATFSVNGIIGYSVNAGQTGAIRRTVFTDAGPGWNSFNIGFGNSMGTIGINKINLYERARDMGISYGLLAEFEINQSFVNKSAVNATQMALGLHRRIYADQLYLKGGWVRGVSSGFAGGAGYVGATTTSFLIQQYYGKEFAIIGTANGGTLTIDGAGVPLAFNTMNTSASLVGFHTVQYACASSSAIIEAFDYVRPYGEIKSLQKFSGPVVIKDPELNSEVYVSGTAATSSGYGTTNTKIRRFLNIQKNVGTAITYTDSVTLGGAFLINEDGLYNITGQDYFNGGGGSNGASIDTNQPTVSIDSISALHRLDRADVNSTFAGKITATFNAKKGSVVRAHTDGSSGTNNDTIYFRITKIG